MGIPTTSNHWKSIHGHLNYITPREFFFRLVYNLMLIIANSFLRINIQFSKNYIKKIQKVSKIFEEIDKIVINEESEFFFINRMFLLWRFF